MLGTAIIVGVVGLILCVLIVLLIKYTPVFKVHEQQAVIIERFGRFDRVLGPGIHGMWPFGIEEKKKFNDGGKMIDFIDMRERLVDLPPQKVITKDNVQIEVDSIAYYRIENAISAMYHIADVVGAINQLIKTELRNLIGDTPMQELLGGQEEISERLRERVIKKLHIAKQEDVKVKPTPPPGDLTEPARVIPSRRAIFKITEQCLEQLKEEGVPEKIRDALKSLAPQTFTREEEFEHAIEQLIDKNKEETGTYKDLIVKHARGVSFNLPEQRLKELRQEGVSEKILDGLQSLAQQKFIKEDEFVHTVEQLKNTLDKKETGKFTDLVWEHAQVSFNLSKQCLEQLKQERVPEKIRDGLKSLAQQTFTREEEFEHAVEQLIAGIHKEETGTYKDLIVKHAKSEVFQDTVVSSTTKIPPSQTGIQSKEAGKSTTSIIDFITRISKSKKGGAQSGDTQGGDWGITIRSVELQSITPPPTYVEMMRTVSEAELAKKAAITKAEGEKQARILEAEGEAEKFSQIYAAIHRDDPNDELLKVRYLEALEKIADGKATKIFMPFPTNPTSPDFFQQAFGTAAGFDAYQNQPSNAAETNPEGTTPRQHIRRVRQSAPVAKPGTPATPPSAGPKKS